jgi:hypothetical protein
MLFLATANVRIIQSDVLLVLLDPGLNGMSSLTNVDLTRFAGYVADASCFHSMVILGHLRTQTAEELPQSPPQHPYQHIIHHGD